MSDFAEDTDEKKVIGGPVTMESIPKDPYVEHPPNALEEIRKQFNLHTPGAMAEVIDNFEEWIRKQNHFTKKDFSRQVLENTVISSKGSLERAKRCLEKICTAKTLRQDFFMDNNVNDFPDLTKFIINGSLPKMTHDYYRVYALKVVSTDFDTKKFNYYLKFVKLIIEYGIAHDYFMGLHLIIDISKDVNIVTLLLKFDIMEFKYFVSLALEGYGLRLKGLHIITDSKSVDAVVSFAKQVLSAKLRDRIHVHKNHDSLHEHIVPKDILPEDFGGKEKPLISIHKEIHKILGSKECIEYFDDVCRPGTDEALRPADQYNEHVLGMSGSFRHLRVD